MKPKLLSDKSIRKLLNETSASLLLVTAFVGMIFVPVEVTGAFHFWDINEIYSNSDGTRQFIELTTSSNGQQFLDGHTITANSDGTLKTYTWTIDSPSPTANTKILLATTSMAAASGFPTPDFTMPDNFFVPTANTLTFNFGENADIVIINGGIPVDGINSVDDSGTVQTASPTNYAGEVGNPPFGDPQCSPPESETWMVTFSCTLDSSSMAPSNVVIENNSVLTIPDGITLTITSGNNITINSGGGLLIKDGGSLVVLA